MVGDRNPGENLHRLACVQIPNNVSPSLCVEAKALHSFSLHVHNSGNVVDEEDEEDVAKQTSSNSEIYLY